MTFGFVDRRSIRLSYWRRDRQGTRPRVAGFPNRPSRSLNRTLGPLSDCGVIVPLRDAATPSSRISFSPLVTMNILAAILGLAIGSTLGVGVALLARRLRSPREAGTQTRRSLLGTPEQRRRVAWMAAMFALAATLGRAVGAEVLSTFLMLLAIMLAVQTATFSLIARVRRGA